MTLMTLRIAFDGAMLVLFAAAWYVALSFSSLAQDFPIAAAALGVAMTSLLLLRDSYSALRVKQSARRVLPEEDMTAALVRSAQEDGGVATVFLRFGKHLAWIGGFLLAVWLLSMPIGSVLYLLLFLRVEARVTWRFALIGAVATFAGLWIFVAAFDLALPASLWNPLGELIE